MASVVPATDENLSRAADILRRGELVCFPTETVYGLGADASNPKAVRRIFRAKGRPANHPLIVHLPGLPHLHRWAIDVPESALTLGRLFWPGPLTLVLRRGPRVPLEVTGGQETVAVRVPGHPVALRLLAEFGGALAAPSANRFGRLSPTLPQHAADELGGEVALVLDGGPSEVGVESTILDLSGGPPRLLRPGAVSRERLAEVLACDLSSNGSEMAPRVPGTLPSHYAPNSPVELLRAAKLSARLSGERSFSVLSRRPAPAEFEGKWLQLPDEPEGYARRLYAALRELDQIGSPIIIDAPPREPAWEAVNDRLLRASAPRGQDRDVVEARNEEEAE
ncbi:MAG: L-threonylcarbamoyladenylate synthase [Trueperaceae bacterium]